MILKLTPAVLILFSYKARRELKNKGEMRDKSDK